MEENSSLSLAAHTAYNTSVANSSRKIRVVFRTDSISKLNDFLRMQTIGQIKLSQEDIEKATQTISSGDWEHDSNRVFVATLTDKFDISYFCSLMMNSLEEIDPCKPKEKKITVNPRTVRF